MGNKTWLVATFIILLLLPSALAINCTKFKGDYRNLCKVINPLPLTESYKKSLMKDDLYQTPNIQYTPINLEVEEQEQVTFNQIYDSKISLIVKIVIFILINYIFFKVLIKFSKVKKWLPAVF